ncbi:unnamed protein product, partial [Pelagomonas calceolata]
MILTTCAACAAPLAHNAPRCVRCWTRYCDATCQHDHWRRGHKQMCKKIHRGGNAEQYNANKKYKEANRFIAALNLSVSLMHNFEHAEACVLTRKTISAAVLELGEDHETTLLLRHQLCQGLIRGGAQTRDDIADALESIIDAFKRFQRVFG